MLNRQRFAGPDLMQNIFMFMTLTEYLYSSENISKLDEILSKGEI